MTVEVGDYRKSNEFWHYTSWGAQILEGQRWNPTELSQFVSLCLVSWQALQTISLNRKLRHPWILQHDFATWSLPCGFFIHCPQFCWHKTRVPLRRVDKILRAFETAAWPGMSVMTQIPTVRCWTIDELNVCVRPNLQNFAAKICHKWGLKTEFTPRKCTIYGNCNGKMMLDHWILGFYGCVSYFQTNLFALSCFRGCQGINYELAGCAMVNYIVQHMNDIEWQCIGSVAISSNWTRSFVPLSLHEPGTIGRIVIEK